MAMEGPIPLSVLRIRWWFGWGVPWLLLRSEPLLRVSPIVMGVLVIRGSATTRLWWAAL